MIWLVGLLFVTGAESYQYNWRNWWFRNYAKSLLIALGVELSVAGIAPTTPCILVANHLSYLDILILAAQFDCLFVAKSEVARWPVIGTLCRNMATIFITRQRKRDILRVNQAIENALRSGKSVMFFPEGTTTEGSSVLPFKSALFEPAAKTKTPVAYASLSYQTAFHETPAATSVCWWGEADFVRHFFGLLGLKKIEASISFGSETIISNHRKQLARDAHSLVSGLFAPAPTTLQSVNKSNPIIAHRVIR